PRGGVPTNLPESRSQIEFGKAEVLGIPGVRRGEEVKVDAVVVAVGSMVTEAWHAAQVLGDSGVKVCVINARWCKPIDLDTIAEWSGLAPLMVTVEENVRTGGFGQQVRDGLGEIGALPAGFRVMSLPDDWVHHGTQPIIRGEVGLSVDGII